MIVVIGAGVAGLATGLALAMRRREVCVVDRHGRPGQESSTHNSGVIHAGLYHPPDSLKTRLCHEGRARLYVFCRDHGVPHVRCGKLIVAAAGEEQELEALARSAAANGVTLEPIDARGVKDREPHVAAAAALWSLDSGWIDADAYVRRLAAELQRHEGVFLPGTPVHAIEVQNDGTFDVVTARERIRADVVVNAAGLDADSIAAMTGGDAFKIYPCRGEYAELAVSARHLVRGLVYPVPHHSGHGLGVHLTKTLGGAVWIGPTIRYQAGKDDYERERLPLDAFLEPARKLLPDITLADLRPGGSGIRAKIHPASARFADFLIRRDSRLPSLVHVAGIDSPGLTASLAIGEYVADLLA